MKRARDWRKIKGFRKKNPQIPVLAATPNLCQVFHSGCVFEFWTDKLPNEELTWESVHGAIVDKRVSPPLPLGFNPLHPLKKPDRKALHEAKKVAFAVLKQQRERIRTECNNPLLFPDLPISRRK